MTKTNPTEKNFDEMSKLIDKFFEDREERNQARGVIQKNIDYRIVEGVCDNLPEEKHEEFIDLLADNPNNGDVVTKYLRDNGIADKVEKILEDVSRDLVGVLREDSEARTEVNIENHSEGKVPVK